MNDYRKPAKIIAVGLALYIIITAGFCLFCTLPQLMPTNDPSWRGKVLAIILANVFAIVYAAVILWLLYRAGDRIIDKLAGPQQDTPENVDWLAFSFRLLAVGSGIYLLSGLLSHIVESLMSAILMKDAGSAIQIHYIEASQLARWIAVGAFTIYLLCGAPHFVRWQVKKTLQQCSRTKPQDQPATDNNEA